METRHEDARVVGYLPDRTHVLWDNATAKLHEAKLCILFCLFPRASVLHGARECRMSVSLLHDAPWSSCFSPLQKVSGQQILEVYL